MSPVGAQGIAQFMPGTASERGLFDPFDPVSALPKAAEFLEELHHTFGNLGLAAAAYNAGPMVVGNWAATFRGRSEDEFVELIQYQETRQYVKRVLRSYKEYLRLAVQQKPVS